LNTNIFNLYCQRKIRLCCVWLATVTVYPFPIGTTKGESDVWECQCRAVSATGCMSRVYLNVQVNNGFISVLQRVKQSDQ